MSSPGLCDGHGRRITYLRLSVTDLCNLRCAYCMPAEGVRKLPHGEILRLEEILEVAREAVALGIERLRITGGEPLVRRGIAGLVRDLARLPGVGPLAMTTNGTLLAGRAVELREAGLARVNVSLDSLEPDAYREITRGGVLADALAGIDDALAAGLRVKVNAVLLGTNPGSLPAFVAFGRERGVEVRFIERMTFGERGAPFSEEQALAVLRAATDVSPLPADPASAHVRRFDAGGVTVGFISPLSHAFCGACNRLRLAADGRLRPCLAGPDHVDVKAVLRRPHEPGEVREALREAVRRKPVRAPWTARGEMWRMGG